MSLVFPHFLYSLSAHDLATPPFLLSFLLSIDSSVSITTLSSWPAWRCLRASGPNPPPRAGTFASSTLVAESLMWPMEFTAVCAGGSVVSVLQANYTPPQWTRLVFSSLLFSSLLSLSFSNVALENLRGAMLDREIGGIAVVVTPNRFDGVERA